MSYYHLVCFNIERIFLFKPLSKMPLQEDTPVVKPRQRVILSTSDPGLIRAGGSEYVETVWTSGHSRAEAVPEVPPSDRADPPA